MAIDSIPSRSRTRFILPPKLMQSNRPAQNTPLKEWHTHLLITIVLERKRASGRTSLVRSRTEFVDVWQIQGAFQSQETNGFGSNWR